MTRNGLPPHGVGGRHVAAHHPRVPAAPDEEPDRAAVAADRGRGDAHRLAQASRRRRPGTPPARWITRLATQPRTLAPWRSNPDGVGPLHARARSWSSRCVACRVVGAGLDDVEHHLQARADALDEGWPAGRSRAARRGSRGRRGGRRGVGGAGEQPEEQGQRDQARASARPAPAGRAVTVIGRRTIRPGPNPPTTWISSVRDRCRRRRSGTSPSRAAASRRPGRRSSTVTRAVGLPPSSGPGARSACPAASEPGDRRRHDRRSPAARSSRAGPRSHSRALYPNGTACRRTSSRLVDGEHAPGPRPCASSDSHGPWSTSASPGAQRPSRRGPVPRLALDRERRRGRRPR